MASCKAIICCALACCILGGETMESNSDLTMAKRRKKDEFYTQLSDIEKEMRHYKHHFEGKVVLCNCDDPRSSNFFRYFSEKFEALKLKKLIATCYKSQDTDLFSQGTSERAICQIYEGDKNGNCVVDDNEVGIIQLKGDGDFRSEECIEIKAAVDRQGLLETAIAWIAKSNKSELIEQYMGIHQGDEDATDLWLYFQKVIAWVKTIFPKYRKEMKGLDWGGFFTKYGEQKYNPTKLEQEVADLMADKEVQRKSGVYEFLLSGRMLAEKLNLRAFDPDDMRTAYENQLGICPICKKRFEFEEMRGDHIKPWSKGGKTVPENLQMLCAECNARKSDKF